ncbi:MAG: efflux RND transporter periplasmic adaptor subunit [Phycisphaerales bacterium]|nr:efflux RND transporter periplasmic adaptor subunit [Phycisphaerales bacterium]
MSKSGGLARTLALGGIFTLVVIGLLLWLAGVFTPKIDRAHHTEVTGRARPAPPGLSTATVRTATVPVVETAVGTVGAVHESAVSAKILARITEINGRAGQLVAEGDVLVQLDDADLRARLQQAEAAQRSAEAAYEQARTEHDRIAALFEQARASRTEFDRAGTDLRRAAAESERAAQMKIELETMLSYATLRSPLNGVVVDRLAEVGDTAVPGQPLLRVYDPTHMQLIARVRESLTRHMRVGEDIEVAIDALDLVCSGQISEIVPAAEGASRTFAVKVTGPCPPGAYAGMFGRLIIPLGEEQTLVIPTEAVQRVGQLTLVDVVRASGAANPMALERRSVRLGRQFDDGTVEVLAGLSAGERIALGTATHAPDPVGDAETGAAS